MSNKGKGDEINSLLLFCQEIGEPDRKWGHAGDVNYIFWGGGVIARF